MKHPNWYDNIINAMHAAYIAEDLAQIEIREQRKRFLRLQNLSRYMRGIVCNNSGKHSKHLGCSGRSYDLT